MSHEVPPIHGTLRTLEELLEAFQDRLDELDRRALDADISESDLDEGTGVIMSLETLRRLLRCLGESHALLEQTIRRRLEDELPDRPLPWFSKEEDDAHMVIMDGNRKPILKFTPSDKNREIVSFLLRKVNHL